MVEVAHEIIPITIEDELKQSYLDYAMSVIIGRALPDVRDGLKPVHRRVLYAMSELGNDWNKPYKKSARIVGDVIGKYHPHGDSAVYDTIVRMAQSFSLRYLLIDGQGNFGSVDGDAPAAMRYTEIRLSRFAHTLMADLDKETVDFFPNYDETEMAPLVFPTRVPNLLVNGSSGIAVGMATNIPPHNLNEIISATLALIDNPNLNTESLMRYIPGPDFSTAGIISGRNGIIQAYKTGRGRIYVRAKTEIETTINGRSLIVVYELPYQVNKARLLEKISELIHERRIEGISGLRDESDKHGMRMVIEVSRNDNAEVVLNNLYARTQLQIVFGINMVALHNGQPSILNLRQLLNSFLQHRRDVVTRRTIFELGKAREMAHILEGLGIALASIDEMIALIKKAKTPTIAKEHLLTQPWKLGSVVESLKEVGSNQIYPDDRITSEYGLKNGNYCLSSIQAQAILDLRLHRLTSLEADKIQKEYINIINKIKGLMEIISDSDKLHEIIRRELIVIKEQFGDERRTVIIDDHPNLTNEDLIPEEQMMITLSHEGYIKSQFLGNYKAQHRGGRGKLAAIVKEQDFIKNILVANTHDIILCFSTYGKVYWLKVYQVPQGSRIARGRPIVNLLPLAENEQISAVLPIHKYYQSHFVFMATAQGIVKKIPLIEFSHARSNGKVVLTLNEDDHLACVNITDGKKEVMLVTDSGKAIRFHEEEVRTMGRLARGVRGIKLKTKQNVVALIVIKQPKGNILTATMHGYGQRTALSSYRLTSRGGQGVMAIRINSRNGKVISSSQVFDNEDILFISDKGTLVRTRVNEISQMRRNTQGVRLIQLLKDESLIDMEVISV